MYLYFVCANYNLLCALSVNVLHIWCIIDIIALKHSDVCDRSDVLRLRQDFVIQLTKGPTRADFME